MARRRRKGRTGLGATSPESARRAARGMRNAARRKGGGERTAGEFYASALENFNQRRRTPRKGPRAGNPCSQIEHYTDVVAEATVAVVLAKGTKLAAAAEKLVRTATRAQRGATHACALRGRRYDP